MRCRQRSLRERLASLVGDLSDAQLDWYASTSGGSLGAAVEGANDRQIEVYGRIAEGLDRLAADGVDLLSAWTDESKALGERYRKRDPDISDSEATQRGLRTIFQLAAGWYDEVLRCASGEAAVSADPKAVARIEKFARSIAPTHLIDAIARLAEAEHHLDLHANTQLCVETLVADLRRIQAGAAVSRQ